MSEAVAYHRKGVRGLGREAFWALWAKAPDGPDERYHPLLYHLIDVAMVAQALWTRGLTPGARQVCADHSLHRKTAVGTWMAFLAALHDLGKAWPGFQYRSPHMHNRLRAAGLLLPPLPSTLPTHGEVTTALLQDILHEQFGMPQRLARTVSYAVGAHHGTFPSPLNVGRVLVDAERMLGGPPWEEARRQVVDSLAICLDLPPLPELPDNLAFGTFLAGFTSTADWIASMRDRFPYEDPEVLTDFRRYAEVSHERANRAVVELYWDAPPRRIVSGFRGLFPHIEKPNPLQHTVADLAPRLAERPSLVILEVPTGEGKTEAAWYLADYWSIAGDRRGVYVAMPTQATSSQLFDRVRVFLEHRYRDDHQVRVPLQLLHGHAALASELKRLGQGTSHLPEVAGEEEDPDGARVMVGEWFTYRKRGLLAPFGVGTIDQALLAVLRVRHGFVRLFGLAGKTVIIDEAHAYDTYMSRLLERLVEWLAALQTHVVVLSATLPESRRRALIRAFRTGAGASEETAEPALPPARYPRVTWADADSVGAIQVTVSPRASRTIRLEWVDEVELADRVCQAVMAGACVAWIVNTVGRAQRLFHGLSGRLGGNADDGLPRVDLLHARFRHVDRQHREHRVLCRFGKPGGKVVDTEGRVHPVRRPRGALLVTTQIVEQSLDLDFDLMVSDLAPIDLLLQRVGRLHRHPRKDRPELFDTPILWVPTPQTDADGIPVFDPGTAQVYHPHVLLRTWLTLCDASGISVPGEVSSLIESVYGDIGVPPEDTNLRRYWEETLKDLGEMQTAEAREAEARWLRPPNARVNVWELMQDTKAEDAPDFHRSHQALTRLAPPTVSLVPVFPAGDGQVRLSPSGARIDLNQEPDRQLTTLLPMHAIPVSHRRLAPWLLSQEAPVGWRRSPLLRSVRPVMFDAFGMAVVGEFHLRLDEELGLVVAGEGMESAATGMAWGENP